jgi:regulator of sigma E protease
VEQGSPAQQAGIRPGDQIMSVGGRHVSTWGDAYMRIGARPNQELAIVVRRNGGDVELPVRTASEGKYDVGDIGVLPNVHPHFGQTNPGSPAEKAGVQRGDVVLAVNGKTVIFGRQLVQEVAKNANTPVTVTVSRNGHRVDLHPTPAGPPGKAKIGVQIFEQTKIINPGPLGAIKMSVEKNYQWSGLIYQTLAGLLTRETSPKQLMGPVAIAQLSGEYAELGWLPYFLLMASISLNLGLLNLLPIPVLDGGHIFIMAIEGVARRDFSTKVKEKMLLAGFVILMMLMVTVIYNDLTRIQWIERLMFWR